jgi:hypothetical protein
MAASPSSGEPGAGMAGLGLGAAGGGSPLRRFMLRKASFSDPMVLVLPNNTA